ncbi:MAG TPA: AMP-binding protein, partial [Kofleriaceae bacterium]|nr:AMP-binding protein [Kofleriaceae bacterium]
MKFVHPPLSTPAWPSVAALGPAQRTSLQSHRPDQTLPATFGEVIDGLDRADAGIRFGAGELRSYAELGALIRGNALHFRASGVRPGDRVAISLESDAEHVVTLLALIALGAVPVSIKPRRGPSEDYSGMLRGVCERFDVRFAQHALPAPPTVQPLSWDEHARAAGDVPSGGARPDDVAVVQFSSGSLGAPKAIPLRHRNLLANLRAILEVDGREASSVVYNFLPLSHDMGLIGGLLSNLALQNSLYLTRTQAFLRNPMEGFLHSRCETVPMPNFALRYLARALQTSAARGTILPPDLFSRVRTIYCGAEPIRHETVAELMSAAAPHGLVPS